MDMKPAINALLLILFVVAPTLGLQQKAPESLTRYSPENCRLSLELPIQSAPSIIKTPIPETMKGYILYINSSFVTVGDMEIIYTHMSTTESMQPKSFAMGMINSMVRSPGVTDHQFTTEPSTDAQAPIKGTMKLNDVDLEVNALVLSKEKHVWSVACVYKKSDKKAREMGQHVLASIRLDGAPCPEK
jgi:hypothetical protein